MSTKKTVFRATIKQKLKIATKNQTSSLKDLTYSSESVEK